MYKHITLTMPFNIININKDVYNFMELIHHILEVIVEFSIYIFEFIGVIVILIAGVKGIIEYFHRHPLTRLNLAKGMAMSLEFKLGSEILRTVMVRDFKEIMIIAGIIFLRAALTFIIHWEIKNEKSEKSQS